MRDSKLDQIANQNEANQNEASQNEANKNEANEYQGPEEQILDICVYMTYMTFST